MSAPEENVDPGAFELIFPDGNRVMLVAEPATAKAIWLEELESAIFCIKAAQRWKNLGWQHEVIRSSIYSAAMYGDLAALKVFIESRGIQLDAPDESGMTALHWASMFGHKEAVLMLLDAGCDIDCMNGGLNSPLLVCSAMGHADISFLLIERGADINLRNLRDMDCLFMSVLFGGTNTDLYDIIGVLQRKGIDINETDSSGASPLHLCAASSNPRPIQALVDCGADVNMKHA
jgi:ankyrin repeat protein